MPTSDPELQAVQQPNTTTQEDNYTAAINSGNYNDGTIAVVGWNCESDGIPILGNANITIVYYYANESFNIVRTENTSAEVLWIDLNYSNWGSTSDGLSLNGDQTVVPYGGWSHEAYWKQYPTDIVVIGWCNEMKILAVTYNNYTTYFDL